MENLSLFQPNINGKFMFIFPCNWILIINLKLKGNSYQEIKLSMMKNLLWGDSGPQFPKTTFLRWNPFWWPQAYPKHMWTSNYQSAIPTTFGKLDSWQQTDSSKIKMLFTRGQTVHRNRKKLLKEGITEPSVSLWRAQSLVIAAKNHKKRMIIDYSQTINRYTLLDAYPQPRIDEIIFNFAKYHIFNTLDLKSTYQQVPIKHEDRPYMAFKACSHLYQFL